jgi:chromosome segregation ATPase
MATDETPIWEVLEDFKEKIKTQELELKKRRDRMEAQESDLDREKLSLVERASKLDAREKALEARLMELEPRERSVQDKEERIKSQEKEVRRREEEVQRSRVELERRQVDITRREESIITLAGRSAEYEKDIRAMSEHVREMEAALIQDQERTRQMLDELSTLREGLLAKGKVLADQETLLAEGRKIVLEEQKRFVGWEKVLNEREESIVRRTNEQPYQPVEDAVEEEEIAPESFKKEAVPEPEPEVVPVVVEEAPEPAQAPQPDLEEEPTPVYKAPETAPIEEEEPETPVFKAEEKTAAPTCPRCHKTISTDDEKCPSCGHVLKETAKQDEIRDEGRDEPKKAAVSIRKIIRRK